MVRRALYDPADAGQAREIARVSAFRNRLVEYVNYVMANFDRYASKPPSDNVTRHIGDEQTALSQEYGRVARLLNLYGKAMMRAYGMTVSQDVERDAIQSPTHPGYGGLAKMAIGHLDMIIGQVSADVGTRNVDDLYRLTSPLFWLGQARRVRAMGRRHEPSAHHRGALAARGRHRGGIASGAAGALMEQLFKAT